MRVFTNIFSLFSNKFNNFNNAGARMLDYIYHAIKIALKLHIWCEKVKILSLCMLIFKASLHNITKQVVYKFRYMVLYHSQTQHHVIK